MTPCSSGSTHVGLSHAAIGTSTRVIGLACDPEPEILDDLILLAQDLEALAPRGEIQLDFRLDWAGEAYGIPSPEGDAALLRLAQTEGIFLDPIYSGQGLRRPADLAARGEVSVRVLFWHTGGIPALFV